MHNAFENAGSTMSHGDAYNALKEEGKLDLQITNSSHLAVTAVLTILVSSLCQARWSVIMIWYMCATIMVLT